MREEIVLININKCNFVMDLAYLGFAILVECLKKAIIKWHTPRSIIGVRSFHGIENFCKKLIMNFSSICVSLIETIIGDRKDFMWTIGGDKGFDVLKEEQTIFEFSNYSRVF